ncbi:Asp-tRNA(Asn)/Glu-tRNA(Gln) amidotransferase A subunit family amidase [Rhodoligotrophos appendicifer]|uniref:amidase n=1 Tax=Rhodoligotrophos appendicifer TaxID=987056 RepID=UPI00117BF79B|nr:amidase [Rhodoligotrophos appendicifer]
MSLDEQTKTKVAPKRPAPSKVAAMTAAQGLRAVEAGELTFEAWARACLDRIEQRNGDVKAWVHFNPKALDHARAMDRGPRPSPLAGVPLGIKDIMDTADMPTELGDPEIFPGRQPTKDAATVTMMRELGFTILGKNTVSRHSIMLPGPARNPHDLSRTPGASSAGSAAAVADFMTPLSLGTQTGGSIVRPSTFCGVVGFKPTIDTFPYAGLRRYSRPLDTVGVLSRSVEDTTMVMREVLGDPRFDAKIPVRRDFKVGVWRPLAWNEAEQSVRDVFDESVKTLSSAGVNVTVLEMPKIFETMVEDHDVIMAYDLARSFKEIRRDHPEKCDPELLEYLDLGDTYGDADYARALSGADQARRAFYDVARDVDVLVSPATLNEAPDASYTGSNAFIRLWTILHNPALTLPVARGPHGLPIGVQAIGFVNEDASFLYWARCLEAILGNKSSEV